MRVEPSHPMLRLVRLHGAEPASPRRAVQPVDAPRAVDRPGTESRIDDRSIRMTRLVAAVVPGGVDFTGKTPQPARDALPLYRHPADRNAAATAVGVGRMIDISA
ncbi:MAG: hypothetical protein KAS72_07140 [Phycisphaerales bacterium]|nr:hypothetical protein [Phycisphaerales bacterium]